MNGLTDNQKEEKASRLDNDPVDLYYGHSSTVDATEEDKNDPLLLLAFIFFPAGIYFYFKNRKKNRHLANKFCIISIFGMVMLLLLRFLLLFFD